MNENCLENCVVYQAEVSSENHKKIGSTEPPFKSRWKKPQVLNRKQEKTTSYITFPVLLGAKGQWFEPKYQVAPS